MEEISCNLLGASLAIIDLSASSVYFFLMDSSSLGYNYCYFQTIEKERGGGLPISVVSFGFGMLGPGVRDLRLWQELAFSSGFPI